MNKTLCALFLLTSINSLFAVHLSIKGIINGYEVSCPHAKNNFCGKTLTLQKPCENYQGYFYSITREELPFELKFHIEDRVHSAFVITEIYLKNNGGSLKGISFFANWNEDLQISETRNNLHYQLSIKINK